MQPSCTLLTIALFSSTSVGPLINWNEIYTVCQYSPTWTIVTGWHHLRYYAMLYYRRSHTQRVGWVNAFICLYKDLDKNDGVKIKLAMISEGLCMQWYIVSMKGLHNWRSLAPVTCTIELSIIVYGSWPFCMSQYSLIDMLLISSNYII